MPLELIGRSVSNPAYSLGLKRLTAALDPMLRTLLEDGLVLVPDRPLTLRAFEALPVFPIILLLSIRVKTLVDDGLSHLKLPLLQVVPHRLRFVVRLEVLRQIVPR